MNVHTQNKGIIEDNTLFGILRQLLLIWTRIDAKTDESKSIKVLKMPKTFAHAQ